MNVYELQKSFALFQQAVQETGGEITPELESVFLELQGSRDEKLEALAAMIKNTRAAIGAFDAEIQRLEMRRNSLEVTMERLESLVAVLLPVTASWDGGVHKLSYRQSKAIGVVDIDAVPEEFFRTKTTRELDKAKATEFLKQSTESEPRHIPGLAYGTKYNLQVK